jgi:uncharacterized membrane protein YqaE (UPF0057 family)
MLYLLAIVLPPVAVLLCGKPLQALLSVILTICFWVPGAIHALFVVNSHLADKRTNKLIQAMEKNRFAIHRVRCLPCPPYPRS